MKSETRYRRGFTLIELMVTVAIFVFMTALIVSRYGAFNQGTLMTNLAFDVALTIRTAQSFGVSVKGSEDTIGRINQTFNNAYGVHFDVSSSVPANFFTYLDSAPPNGLYSTNDGDNIYSTYKIKQGATVSSLCVGNDGQSCNTVNLTSLDISFRRPDPSAVICAAGGISAPCVNGQSGYNFAAITLKSADGSSLRTVEVRGNGQISVDQ